jgi:hypothetical protein
MRFEETEMTVRTATNLPEDLEPERRRLVAAARAGIDEQPHAIVACVPQRLPGEYIADVVAFAASHIAGLVRDTDTMGIVDDEIIVFGLVDAGPNAARAIAHRLQGDLHLHSRSLRSTVWETAAVCWPADGVAADDLLATAIEGAMTRRRRLGG